MISRFNQLVQTKRRKMLILTAFLFLLAFMANKSESINLTYIVKKDQNHQLRPSCVAAEESINSAIGWVYPIPKDKNQLPNITTKLIPTIDNNNYNCKFSADDLKCNKMWTLKNWHVDTNSSNIFDFIVDARWETFPIIFTSNDTKEFQDRIEIPNVFRVGFSVRAATSNVELFICEGWNPYNYPCYHLSISRMAIMLRKYMTVPQKTVISNDEEDLDNIVNSYKAYSNILSDDEWRNFIISLSSNGKFELIDVNLNRTVIHYQDNNALKPLYLLLRSANSSLWKIHNNQFMSTTTAQISRLGPTLQLPTKDLCISLYVSMCPFCVMSFFILRTGAERTVLKEIYPTNNKQQFEWRSIKLKAENILDEKVNIFLETRLIDGQSVENGSENVKKGFWAIDDVRVCHENEIKVSFLHLLMEGHVSNDSSSDAAISCQLVEHPKWRPKQLIYPEVAEFPVITSSANSTAISLAWNDDNLTKQIDYFITYAANDICTSEPFNMRRMKSNGFLVTKHNELTINDLIPYTHYNITFSTVVHEREKHLTVNTLESDLPTPEEIPNNLKIQVTDSNTYVSWSKVDCTSIYGHIIYSLKLINKITNITELTKTQIENYVAFSNLNPYTLYSLNIITLRDSNNSSVQKPDRDGIFVEFKTKATVAPAVKHVETYSVDNDSASFRYTLPDVPRGVPINVRLVRCNVLFAKKCKTAVDRIRSCSLWPNQYCIDAFNLIPNQTYTFKLSIQNNNTQHFGDETELNGVVYTVDRVPGAPENITYAIVDCHEALDYCHLNISWRHPYKQNGTIMDFDIILKSISNTTDGETSEENIHEVFRIDNKNYSSLYNYQIKYIPYSTSYNLSIQSVNTQYKSSLASIEVRTADIGEHINQKPNLTERDDVSVIFTLPHVDRRLKSYNLTVIVQDYNKNSKINDYKKNMKLNTKILCHDFGETWISHVIQVDKNNNHTQNITIGKGDSSENKQLKAATKYCITFVLTNRYKNAEHDVIYYEKIETMPQSLSSNNDNHSYDHLYVLLLLLLLVPVGFLLYKYCIVRRRQRPNKSKGEQTSENVYESLPFEECEDNCVHNATYDQLLHK